MRLPVTEKFLWDLFKFFSKIDHQGEFDFFLNPYSVKRFFGGGKKHFDALQNEIYKKYKKRYGAIRLSKFVYYLKKRGYIETKDWETRKGLALTPKGLNKILKRRNKEIRLPIRKDKRWQMVVFDIPEKSRKVRDIFRDALKVLGYQQLQKSIWVSPYEVAEKTKEIISSLNLEDEVKLFIIDSIQEMELKKSIRKI